MGRRFGFGGRACHSIDEETNLYTLSIVYDVFLSEPVELIELRELLALC